MSDKTSPASLLSNLGDGTPTTMAFILGAMVVLVSLTLFHKLFIKYRMRTPPTSPTIQSIPPKVTTTTTQRKSAQRIARKLSSLNFNRQTTPYDSDLSETFYSVPANRNHTPTSVHIPMTRSKSRQHSQTETYSL